LFAGRYQIIEELGRGGMGRVYKAFDTEIEEVLSLKLLNPEVTADEQTIQRLQRELRLAHKVSHQSVCRLSHFSCANGTHFVTMEYVLGQNLKHMLGMMKQLNLQTAVSIAKQVCEGLAEAHRVGIVHRDLKPSNLMLDRTGRVRIMDFGLSAGLIVGTPFYMSPEQVEAGEVDLRSDIYSLGVILYEMVTGTVPFQGQTPAQTAIKHKTEKPTDPGSINPLVPESLSRAILRCLAKDRHRRFQDVRELFDALSQVEDDLSALTGRMTPAPAGSQAASSPPALESAGRRRVWAWPAVVILLVLAFTARLAFLGFGKAAAPPAQPLRKMLVVLPFENLGPPEDDYFAAGLTEELGTRLSALKELGVISRHSARFYQGTEKTAREIHEELGVDYILDGTVQRLRSEGEPDRVRVTAQLIQAEDDTQLWSELNNLVLEDFFGIQTLIAEDVASKLDLTVLEPEREALRARPTDDLEAYDMYHRARDLASAALMRVDADAYAGAISLLEKAVERDPDFTLAYLTLAITHQWIYQSGLDRSRERLDMAWAALAQAKRLDADLPEVLLAEGFLAYQGDQDYDKALEVFERVKRVRPNLPYTYLGYIQRRRGLYDEALQNLERSFTFLPRSADLAFQIGYTYIQLRRYEEAWEWCNRAIALDRGSYLPYLAKVRIALLGRGNVPEARFISRTIPQHQYSDYILFLLNMLERDYAGALDVLSSSDFDSFVGEDFFTPKSSLMAAVYADMGDEEQKRWYADQACRELEAALEENPEDPRIRLSLGLALALLGRREEAVREGLAAVASCPLESDALEAPRYVLSLAAIYAVVGEPEEAIRRLDRLLSTPCGNILSVPWLRIDPSWDGIRDHPAFKRLLDKYAREAGGDGA
jgi:TolB-like protein/Flp pilus assembly protein TadD